MKKTSLILMVVICVIVMSGCGAKEMKTEGFLSDYSKLQKESNSSLRYLDTEALKEYSAIIVDPVIPKVYHNEKTKKKLTEEELTDLIGYIHAKMVEAVEGAGKKVAYRPGTGVARLRIALTNLSKTNAINVIPTAALLGTGIGGATVEMEIVDSMTGQQIGALVQSKQGSHIPFANLGDWKAAKNVIDSWAKRLQERLSE
jgi:hypothetical protein